MLGKENHGDRAAIIAAVAIISSGKLEPEQLVVGEGWLVANYSQVQCTFVGPELSDAAYAAHLQQLERDILGRSDRRKIGVFYYTPETKNMDSPRRRALAKLLESHEEKIAKTTAAYALATNSAFVRGVLSTVFWLAPPPYPYKVVQGPEEALRFIADHLLYLDDRAVLASFQDLLARNGMAPAA